MPSFELNQPVILAEAITEDGVTYPAGTRGIIVALDGSSASVEFTEPVPKTVPVPTASLTGTSARRYDLLTELPQFERDDGPPQEREWE
ncbi:hypothetical protein [Microvirga massiliensis]|uniref:hypothetical protein n=1 Tax=Microvirga massiliensis TaxID=1033741 RepID=UPI000B33DAD3|nr:hypothetical protein [Microvirga massiliensis]